MTFGHELKALYAMNFSAKKNEKFYECWERYMEAINACLHHGFDTWLLVSYFYDGMLWTLTRSTGPVRLIF